MQSPVRRRETSWGKYGILEMNERKEKERRFIELGGRMGKKSLHLYFFRTFKSAEASILGSARESILAFSVD